MRFALFPLLRYVLSVALGLAMFALLVIPMIWFAWTGMALVSYRGSAGSIAILFLGAAVIFFYAISLLSYPAAACGYGRLSQNFRQASFMAKVVPWLSASVHFIMVPLLTIFPLYGSVKRGQEIAFLAVAAAVFLGTGAVHRVALLAGWRIFPRNAQAPEPDAAAAAEDPAGNTRLATRSRSR